MYRFRVWWADSRGKVITTLVVLWAAALIHQFQWTFVLVPIVAVTGTIIADLVVCWIRKRQWVFTMSSVVTGLLIGLIFDPRAGILPLLVACAVSAIGKQLIGSGDHRHVGNPAALGILLASLLFSRPVSWWAASWGMIPAAVIAMGMILTLRKLRRLWMPIIFLLIYFLMNVHFSGIQGAINLTIEGTVFLFAFIMLPEPITSVSGHTWRYIWGALVGGFVVVQSMFPIFNIDPLLTALLGANIFAYLFIRKPWVLQ